MVTLFPHLPQHTGARTGLLHRHPAAARGQQPAVWTPQLWQRRPRRGHRDQARPLPGKNEKLYAIVHCCVLRYR
jgi:hypothetical protein